MKWSIGMCVAGAVLLLAAGLETTIAAAAELPPPEAGAEASVEQAPAERARAFFDAGAQAYAKGDYRSAIEAFSWAFRVSQRPGLLFSLGQANFRAYLVDNDPVHLRGAIANYRSYLSAQPSGSRRQEAEQTLERLVPLDVRHDETVANVPLRDKATWLMVSSNTPDARLAVDGYPAADMPFIERVSPGPHDLTLRAKGFESESRRVVVPEGIALGVTFELREQVALLDVATTEGAKIFVDGQRVGEAPLRPMPIKAGSHQIEVRLRGRQVVLRRVKLTPGQLHRERVDLETTGPRYLARGLLVVGGAAALATTALVGYAYAEQSRADELLARRARVELTPAERDDYTHAVARRDDLRTGAVVGGVGTATLGLAALLLWLFEPMPSPQRFVPTTSPRDRVPDLSGALFFDGQLWKASVRARF